MIHKSNISYFKVNKRFIVENQYKANIVYVVIQHIAALLNELAAGGGVVGRRREDGKFGGGRETTQRIN